MSTIFFSVGEPSGDQHAARLATELQRIDPQINLRGFGGPAMQNAGCQIDSDLTQHAVVGVLEVLPKLRDFFALADQAEAVFRQEQIDAVVLVDFPGFNWHIAKRAKKYGIPVYYYCPPQLWAWAGWRINKMRRSVDHVLAVLPVEQEYFQRQQIPCTYVGHPFFDAVQQHPLNKQTLNRFNSIADRGQHLVAVLPGSRDHEVQANWPVMLDSIRQLHRQYPDARFLVAAYRDKQCQWCRDQLQESDSAIPLEFYVGRASEVIQASRCAMMVSGSVSLEMMARRTPAAVIYRVGRLLHLLANLLVRIDSVTLPNLMDRRKVFPEYISVGSPQPASKFLTESIGAMLGDPFYFSRLSRQLDELCRQHAKPGASARAAEEIARLMNLCPGFPSHADSSRRVA
ncbi:MAG: lipid-A-disaccharide synthase [Planctomycetota bacterium]|nr:lipid-A-disaccharide synthase [Planctomycetota bacterium]